MPRITPPLPKLGITVKEMMEYNAKCKKYPLLTIKRDEVYVMHECDWLYAPEDMVVVKPLSFTEKWIKEPLIEGIMSLWRKVKMLIDY